MNYEFINKKKRELGLTNPQIAERAGITLSTLDKITSGVNQNPKLNTLQSIADVIDCKLDDFDDRPNLRKTLPNEALELAKAYWDLDAHGKRVVDFIVDAESDRCKEERQRRAHVKEQRIAAAPRLISMPVYNEPAAAGNPLDAGSDFEYMDFREEIVPDGSEFGVRINGDSMGKSVPDGCIAFVRKSESAEDGDIVIAWVEGEGMVCKRVVADCDQLLYLKSDNETYPNIADDRLIGLRIHGVVVGHT